MTMLLISMSERAVCPEPMYIRWKSGSMIISEFMMDNIGNLLSPNNISETLKNDESEITRKTVSKYIDYLENAFLFYEAKRYDLKEREYSPLLAIRDAYPKMIIASTHHETYDYQGVQVVDLCRWLRQIP